MTLFKHIFVLVVVAVVSFIFPQYTSAKQTYFTVDSDGSGKSVQINKNRAKLSKLRNDVVVTQNKLREAGPQAKDAADNCIDSEKLRWNGSTWSCLRESDHHMNVFAKDPLPVCPLGWVLTTTSTTSLGCNMPEKGPIGPAPTWQKPNGGNNLQIANPDGTWGSSVYIRGDPGDTYTWYTGAYGGCSETTCGPGTRTRVVECRQNTFTTVADSKCASPKPASSTSCHAGWSYAWTGYTAWSSCNSSCSQSRTRDCRRCDGTIVADSYCSGSATDTRACTGGYYWTAYGSYSSWSSCNTSCQQSRSRTRSCKQNCNDATVSSSLCSGSTTDTQTQSCTGGYAWSAYGGWSSCSATCGTGTQSRTRSCRRNCDGATVSSGYCSGSATQSQSCSSTSGCTYSWVYGSWSGCSSSCGSGTQTRSASCRRSDGTTVSSGYCSGSPYTSRSCSSTSGCTYSWIYGSWSGCSNSCGSGTQTRSAYCRRSDGATVSGGYCSGSAYTSRSCSSTSGCTYSWSYGSWSTCSSSCTQTRSASCRRSDGATVSSSYCSGSANTSQSCTGGSCGGGGGGGGFDCCSELGPGWASGPGGCTHPNVEYTMMCP